MNAFPDAKNLESTAIAKSVEDKKFAIFALSISNKETAPRAAPPYPAIEEAAYSIPPINLNI
jgi:hypothetical protein